MKKFTHATKKKRDAAIKRRYNRRQRNNKHNVDSVDRISLLPDDILASVLSRLTLIRAITTSVLSTRWRHLYTKINRLYIPAFSLPQTQDDFSKYVDTINHTLDLFSQNTSLKVFGIEMHHCFQGADLERWLEFALSREVESIDIHLCYDIKSFHYTLPLSNLIIRGGTHLLPGLKSLKELYLSGVKVEDSEVELLLSTFPLLESLHLCNSDRLKNVSFVGSEDRGLRLKKLWMWTLPNIESIEIRDMVNLVSFACLKYNEEYSLRLANVPKLTELHVCESGVNVLHTIPSSISEQLRQLFVFADPTQVFIEPSYELKNVKQLELKVRMVVGYSNHQLRELFPVIKACTSLETLDVKFEWIRYDDEKTVFEEVVDLDPTDMKLSPNLKRFVVSGYTGNKEESELALFVMNSAAALEQMIVEPCDENHTKQRMAIARARKQLRQVAPSLQNLVIKNTLTRSKS